MNEKTKQIFVEDMDLVTKKIDSVVPISLKYQIMSNLSCSADMAEMKLMERDEIRLVVEECNSNILSKYGLVAVNPERIIIDDFTKFNDYIKSLEPESIEESGPRGKNEFRFLFRNKILIGITNQLARLGDTSDPNSIQTNYLIDIIQERPKLRANIIEKKLNQDDSFNEVDEALQMAKQGTLREYTWARKKLLTYIQSNNKPFFYNHHSLEDLFNNLGKSNTWEYNNNYLKSRIGKLISDLEEIKSNINLIKLKGDKGEILLQKLIPYYKGFLIEQHGLVDGLIKQSEKYPQVIMELKYFQRKLVDLSLD